MAGGVVKRVCKCSGEYGVAVKQELGGQQAVPCEEHTRQVFAMGSRRGVAV